MIYIIIIKNTYYHKYTIGQSYTFLEWKQSKDGMWDWYKCTYNEYELINIKNNSIYRKIYRL